MSRIRVLPENVASQIAAGEVVERPASVVRELLDNSLDAGSDRIEIRIEAGGCKQVRVRDNGRGMDRDDLLLCLERHATSKLQALEDLFAIGTLGFRGEAIPSIASVSRLEITSRTRESITGHRLRIEGGRLLSIDETGAPAGTVVSVRDLFFNTPARRKFLRTARTETHHILETVSRIALPHRGVSFRLREGDRSLLHYPASEKELERLAMLFGREAARSMEPLERAAGPVIVRTHLAPPEYSRSRGDRILVYVNGRHVRDRLLTRAVMEGYGQRLMKGRYPQVVVMLEMDPSLVDINVHPTKQEVRFRDGRAVYRAVAATVDEGLAGRGGAVFGRAVAEPSHPMRETSPRGGPGAAEPGVRYEPAAPQGGGRGEGSGAIAIRGQQGFQGRTGFVIGQLKNTYILCQADDGLLLVDQHAAHERIVYEALRKGLRKGAVPSQPFLIPKRVELSIEECGALEAHGEVLDRLGLEVEPFGGTTVLLRAVPSLLVDADPDAFLRELLARIKETGGELESDAALDDVLALMACHSAVRAGKPLSEREMNALLDDLWKTDLPTNCPHGRPVSRKITWGELERMFKRVV